MDGCTDWPAARATKRRMDKQNSMVVARPEVAMIEGERKRRRMIVSLERPWSHSPYGEERRRMQNEVRLRVT